MRKDTTLSELYVRSIEIQRFKKSFPTITLMMASRLGEFEKRNSIYLQKLDTKIEALYNDNVSKDDKGEFEKEIVDDKPTGNVKFISDEHKVKFEEGWKEMMESPCQITI